MIQEKEEKRIEELKLKLNIDILITLDAIRKKIWMQN